ncbi:translation initiation factor IF-6 [Candidatus Micrarchaeota archaeon]|nr:translation initiation factor IF-6 [Candidatus Micrarchaeota archaeon]MBU1165727.1 translation initiation factor IF-6 [Candidatus Micrarchaeota archaeon]MBU1887094.1 translation initiation factor IF-6 [Candidatus Micrarchaeota archaeon]
MKKITYFGNSWLGMFIKTNDSITLLPIDSMAKLEVPAVEILKTTILKTTVGDTNLLGMYTAMNNNGLVLPNIVEEREVSAIKKSGINVYISKEKNNAHGNNVTVNDKGGIINPHVSRTETNAMGDVLGVELVPMKIAEYSTVGSSCIATNGGFLAHYKSTADELKAIEDALKVKGSKGTINTGAGFVAYGIVVNKNGYLAGEQTTAFELGRVEEALGLIK